VRNSLLRSTLRVAQGIVLIAVTAWQACPTAHPRKKRVTNSAPAAVQDVWVGAYLIRIHQISIKDNYFTADFYLWFRWKGDDLKPYNTFSLADAREVSKTEAVVNSLPDGSKYAYVRIVAQVTKFWDLRQYPLDRHDLDLNIEEEENEEDAVHYVADEKNSGAHHELFSMPGWKLVQTSTFAGVGVYRSNFGDISLPEGHESRYSRFTLRASFKRQSDLILLKLLFGVWVGVGIAFVTFFITPDRIDPRFGVGVGAIFAAVASEYIVTQSLPDTNTITLADKLHVLAFAFIFASIIETTVSLHLFQNGRQSQSNGLDRTARWAFPVSFILLNVLVIHLR
jgi:hypothetical protein